MPVALVHEAHPASLAVMSWLRAGYPLTLLMDVLDGEHVPSREILEHEGRPDDAWLAGELVFPAKPPRWLRPVREA